MEELQAGDEVELRDLAESSGLNGMYGTLKKPVGKDKWAVAIAGAEKSKVISVKNMVKVEKFDPTSVNFSIVGTWDDWEAHQMEWDPAEECFMFDIVLGSEGVESFKILLEEDWDYCVYPDAADATPYEPHGVLGPDDGNESGEWTVGKHAKDSSVPGSGYKIRLFVNGDGTPQKVDWRPADEGAAAAPPAAVEEADVYTYQKPKPAAPSRFEEDTPAVNNRRHGNRFPDDEELPVVSRRRNEEEPPAVNNRRYGNRFPDDEELPVVSRRRDEDNGGRGRNGLFSVWEKDLQAQSQREQDEAEAKRIEEQVLKREEAARKRLVIRLERAAEAEKLAIKDQEDQQREVRATAEKEKEKVQSEKERIKFGYRRDKCVECNQITTVMSNGCCQACWTAYEAVIKEGWNVDAMCNGTAAGVLASTMVSESAGKLSKNQARREVMDLYPKVFFRRPKK